MTLANLEEYIERVTQVFLVDGVQHQFNAFVKGFNNILSVEHLRVFTVNELSTLLCGVDENANDIWNKHSKYHSSPSTQAPTNNSLALLENTKLEHGYNHTSRAIGFLMEILGEFTGTQRRGFLKFVTGSPRLPVGGFKALNPKLTIVRKDHTPPLTPDDYLPSVNTCFYYLKLPDYTSKDVMKEKLLFAIENGQDSFSLS